MATMASLMVEVGGNITQFVSEMTKMEAVAAKHARAIRSEFNNLSGNLAGVISAGLFVHMIKESIDAQDAIFKLSQKVGGTVEELSSLRYAAALADVDMGALGKGLKKLAVNMVDAADTTGKSSKLFAAMGVDVKKGMLPAFEQVADTFAKLEDGEVKAALAVALFGKTGMDLIPLLNKGSEGLRLMREEAERLGIVMTASGAEAAEKFNDNIKSLKFSSEQLGISLVSGLGEAMVAITRAMIKGKEEAGLYGMAVQGLSEVFNQISGDTAVERLKKINDQIVLSRMSAEALRKGGTTTFGIERTGEIKSAEKLNGLLRARLAIEQEISAEEIAAQDKRIMAMLQPKADKALADRLRGILGGSDAAAKEAEAALAKLVAAQKKAEKEMEGMEQNRYDSIIFMQEDAYKKRVALGEAFQAWQDSADKDTLEASIALNNSIIALDAKRMKEAQEMFGGFLDGIDSAFRDTWDSLLNGAVKKWSDAVSALRNAFKRILLDFIYTSLAKPFILQITAALAGVLGLTGLSALASQQAGTSAAGSVAGSAFTSWLGNSAMGTLFGNAATGFGAGWSGAAAFSNVPMAAYGIPALGAMETTAGAAGAWMGTLASNPYTWIAAAAVAAWMIIDRQGGGPKPGGSFFGSYNASGQLTGTMPVTGSDNGRFFTPSDMDAAMKDMTNTFAANFFATLKTLGGKPGGVMSFGIGADRDPLGSAQQRVAAEVMKDGVAVWRTIVNSGRDDADLQKAFAETMSRMLLAGLQVSDLPKGVASILNSVSAATASEADVKNIIELATAFGGLMTILTTPLDVGALIKDSQRTAVEQLKIQGKALLDMADTASLTTADISSLTQATNAYRGATVQLLLQLEEARRGIDDMFTQTVRGFQMATLDDQGKYNYLQAEAEALRTQLMAATDVSTIQRLSERINQNLNESFALLSPEEQAAMSKEFISRTEAVNAEIAAHIKEVSDGVAAAAQENLDKLQAVLDKMAADNATAAAKQVEAADVQLTAAELNAQPRVIYVGSSTEVGS